jgi:hypothetical protein
MEQFKAEFLRTLCPFMEMMEAKREATSSEEWISFVRTIQLRIMNEPEQYLGRELPSLLTVQLVVNEIFEEFVSDNSSHRNRSKMQISRTT